MSGPGTSVKGASDRKDGFDKPASSDATPIKTPHPTDAQAGAPPAETPKVGSEDAPGG